MIGMICLVLKRASKTIQHTSYFLNSSLWKTTDFHTHSWMQRCTAAKAAVQQISKRATQLKSTDCAGKLQVIATEKLLPSSTCKLACSEARSCSLLLLTVLNEIPSVRSWGLKEGEAFRRDQDRTANAQMLSHSLRFWEQEAVLGNCSSSFTTLGKTKHLQNISCQKSCNLAK